MAARYGWIITQDHLHESFLRDYGPSDDNGTSDVGTLGPHGCSKALQARLEAGEGAEFRMHDDDGELYYSGRILYTGDSDGDVEFAPLEDFGMPNAGCTRIYYRQKEPGNFPNADKAPYWLPAEDGQGGWGIL